MADNNAILLEEYKVLNDMARHDDIMVWTSLGLFLPAATAVLAFVANHQFSSRPSQQLDVWELVGAAIVSLSLWLVGVLIAERIRFYTHVRLERAREIEEGLNMDHHLRIEALDKGKPRTLWGRVQRLGVFRTIRVYGLTLMTLWALATWWWAY